MNIIFSSGSNRRIMHVPQSFNWKQEHQTRKIKESKNLFAYKNWFILYYDTFRKDALETGKDFSSIN